MTGFNTSPGGINYVPLNDMDDFLDRLPIEVQAAEASDLASRFKQLTGNPILVTPNQMKYFREAGVDCSNLMLYPELDG